MFRMFDMWTFFFLLSLVIVCSSHVLVAGEVSVNLNSTINRTTSPIVSHISGCMDSPPITINCPTQGNRTLIVYGTNLSTISHLYIGTQICQYKNITETQYTCILPAQTLTNSNITQHYINITVEGYNITTSLYITYGRPRITEIKSGCKAAPTEGPPNPTSMYPSDPSSSSGTGTGTGTGTDIYSSSTGSGTGANAGGPSNTTIPTPTPGIPHMTSAPSSTTSPMSTLAPTRTPTPTPTTTPTPTPIPTEPPPKPPTDQTIEDCYTGSIINIYGENFGPSNSSITLISHGNVIPPTTLPCIAPQHHWTTPHTWVRCTLPDPMSILTLNTTQYPNLISWTDTGFRIILTPYGNMKTSTSTASPQLIEFHVPTSEMMISSIMGCTSYDIYGTYGCSHGDILTIIGDRFTSPSLEMGIEAGQNVVTCTLLTINRTMITCRLPPPQRLKSTLIITQTHPTTKYKDIVILSSSYNTSHRYPYYPHSTPRYVPITISYAPPTIFTMNITCIDLATGTPSVPSSNVDVGGPKIAPTPAPVILPQYVTLYKCYPNNLVNITGSGFTYNTQIWFQASDSKIQPKPKHECHHSTYISDTIITCQLPNVQYQAYIGSWLWYPYVISDGISSAPLSTYAVVMQSTNDPPPTSPPPSPSTSTSTSTTTWICLFIFLFILICSGIIYIYILRHRVIPGIRSEPGHIVWMSSLSTSTWSNMMDHIATHIIIISCIIIQTSILLYVLITLSNDMNVCETLIDTMTCPLTRVTSYVTLILCIITFIADILIITSIIHRILRNVCTTSTSPYYAPHTSTLSTFIASTHVIIMILWIAILYPLSIISLYAWYFLFICLISSLLLTCLVRLAIEHQRPIAKHIPTVLIESSTQSKNHVSISKPTAFIVGEKHQHQLKHAQVTQEKSQKHQQSQEKISQDKTSQEKSSHNKTSPHSKHTPTISHLAISGASHFHVPGSTHDLSSDDDSHTHSSIMIETGVEGYVQETSAPIVVMNDDQHLNEPQSTHIEPIIILEGIERSYNNRINTDDEVVIHMNPSPSMGEVDEAGVITSNSSHPITSSSSSSSSSTSTDQTLMSKVEYVLRFE